jgi:hypothetical protein
MLHQGSGAACQQGQVQGVGGRVLAAGVGLAEGTKGTAPQRVAVPGGESSGAARFHCQSQGLVAGPLA